MSIPFSSFAKKYRMQDLQLAVQYCNLCPRLEGRSKILSFLNGNLDSKVLFIAEAPGRLGADRTGIPLWGDQSGDNFEKLLGNIGWRREDIFITNAILCNPRDENGNNGTPTRLELLNCSVYLEMTIELVDPEVIVTLGSTALEALNLIVPHPYKLNQSVRKVLPWNNRLIFPLYHPGPRALVHRSLIQQRSDFMALSRLVHPVHGLKNTRIKRLSSREEVDTSNVSSLQRLVLAIVESLGRLSYFKLTKLLYLIDLAAIERLGRTLTGEIYLRQQEGPWLPTLRDAISALQGREIITTSNRGVPFVKIGPSPRFGAEFDESEMSIVREILQRYGRLGDARIKFVVYRTAPMRYLLTQEALGRDMRKVPVIYKNKLSWELDKR